mmetsp:Transcript_5011/g.10109  ORF Transcript_5011/g.10109 Transcript_5011/m.10109 type:complete len:160 (-) Transcript_5011:2184-2663(-)
MSSRDSGRGNGADAPSDPSITSDELDRLIEHADRAKARAYAPYSNFRVGAALLTETGDVIAGCNVENSSYGMSMCAERSAIYRAVSTGERRFRAILVTSDVRGTFTYPCGACRQVLSEFGNFDVFCLQPSGKTFRTTVLALLPNAFSKEELDMAEAQRD